MAEQLVRTPWEHFVQRCDACTACPLHQDRKQAVVWRGSVSAPLLIIGEGPGAEEDKQGIPFVGPSGQLLDALLGSLDISPEIYHIANIVKCRPPNNRAPSLEEARACRPFLNEQFQFVKPKVIALMGSSAYKYFTGDLEQGISSVRGKWIHKGGYWIMPSFHPSYILRKPEEKSKLWQDYKQIQSKLEELHILNIHKRNKR